MRWFKRIAPVGNPISLKQKPLTDSFCNAEDAFFYQSGTAALAAALIACKQGKDEPEAEVILPAYACPDLISAAVYANLKPVLVDLAPESTYLDLNKLEQAITSNTCAVIAINFLGISERLQEIKALINQQEQEIFLIEDRAQSYPVDESELELTYSYADISIYSFGKGKPVSLLGGGLVKLHQAKLATTLPAPQGESDSFSALKALVYNLVIHPWLFWLLELLPVKMGTTAYKPLQQLMSLSEPSKAYLQANIESYKQRQPSIKKPLNAKDLSLNTHCSSRLLRQPMLCQNQAQRDALIANSQQQGLGYSALYQTSLPNIEAVPQQVAQQGPFPVAEDFSKRLVTLPTHRYASKQISTKPKRILQVCSGDLWGGAEAQFLTLNKELNKDPNIELMCITFNHGDLSRRLTKNGIQQTTIDENQLSALQMLFAIRKLIQAFKPDVIHTHGAKENTLAALANVISQRAVCIRTAHGAPEFTLNWRQVHKQLFGFADWFCGRFLQKKIIAVSAELAEKLQASYPSSKIVVVENGIDIEDIQTKAEEFIPDFKQHKPDAYHIGIVGRLVPVKRVDLFIETAALLAQEELDKPIYFHIIGDGPLRQALEAQVRELKLDNIVTFYGHQANSAPYLKALDILLMTSDHEGLPMTALEAMALETPIVSHNIGALKETLKCDITNQITESHTRGSYAIGCKTVLFFSIGNPPIPSKTLTFTAQENAIKTKEYYRF